jgi:hypothetical protein
MKEMKDMIMTIRDEKDLMELNRFLIKNIKATRFIKGAAIKEDLKPGMRVNWTGRKGFHTGTIVKVARTRAQVKEEGDFVNGTTWNVPMAMLNIVG